jgi:hypothetical protein
MPRDTGKRSRPSVGVRTANLFATVGRVVIVVGRGFAVLGGPRRFVEIGGRTRVAVGGSVRRRPRLGLGILIDDLARCSFPRTVAGFVPAVWS